MVALPPNLDLLQNIRAVGHLPPAEVLEVMEQPPAVQSPSMQFSEPQQAASWQPPVEAARSPTAPSLQAPSASWQPPVSHQAQPTDALAQSPAAPQEPAPAAIPASCAGSGPAHASLQPAQVTLHAYHQLACSKGRRVRGSGNFSYVKEVLGIFHVGVAVRGKEYTFGMSQGKNCAQLGQDGGVYTHEPKEAGHFNEFKHEESLGTTSLTEQQVLEVAMDMSSKDWKSAGYDRYEHNCVDFGQEFSKRLGAGDVPAWAQRALLMKRNLDPSKWDIMSHLGLRQETADEAAAAAEAAEVAEAGSSPTAPPRIGIEGVETAPSARRYPSGPQGPQGPRATPPRAPARASSVDAPRDPISMRRLPSRPQGPAATLPMHSPSSSPSPSHSPAMSPSMLQGGLPLPPPRFQAPGHISFSRAMVEEQKRVPVQVQVEVVSA